jgi:uncharacterized Zn-binding protein involved in type VI secretion
MSTPQQMADYYGKAPKAPPAGASQEQIDAYKKAMSEYEKTAGPAPTPPDPPKPAFPGAGMPAARLGDMTVHGGALMVGCPTVLIGGQPAARVQDNHACPLVTGVVPHVGGPVAKGSLTVTIGGMPAARAGDVVTCSGPPDAIAMGAPNVLIGG